MAVTSQQQTLMTHDHTQIVNWQATGLVKPSVMKPIVMTLEQQLVIRVLGRLEKDDRESFRALIAQILSP